MYCNESNISPLKEIESLPQTQIFIFIYLYNPLSQAFANSDSQCQLCEIK